MTLIDRLSKLEAPDRDVDAEIAVLFSGDPDAVVITSEEGAIFTHKPGWYATSDDRSHNAPSFTASVDAAIALAERMLPGWHWSIYDTDGVGRCNAQMERPDFTGAEDFDGTGATPAIALLIALLRAKEGSHGE